MIHSIVQLSEGGRTRIPVTCLQPFRIQRRDDAATFPDLTSIICRQPSQSSYADFIAHQPIADSLIMASLSDDTLHKVNQRATRTP